MTEFELPLHPMVVHFPIVLGTLLPLLIGTTIWAIAKAGFSKKLWWAVIIASGLFLLSSFVAVEMGERDEDRVEEVVGHEVLHEHEEAGERLMWISLLVFGSTLIPIFLKNPARWRAASLAASLVAVVPTIQSGHSGGELVYKHGAAKTHSPDQSSALPSGHSSAQSSAATRQ